MKPIPENVKPYKRTPTFTETTVPAGLLKNHQTQKSVWGKLVVVKGEVEYTIETDPPEVVICSSDRHGVIEPQVLHRVRPIAGVEFYVEFYK